MTFPTATGISVRWRNFRRRDAHAGARRTQAGYARYQADPDFKAEFETSSSTTSAARARSITRGAGRVFRGRAGLPQARDPESTPARTDQQHIGQALLARRMGKPRVIAETGAGQQGVATPHHRRTLRHAVRGLHGLRGRQRQASERLPHEASGATVVPVESGLETLKDALNEAMRDWVSNVADTLLHHRTVADQSTRTR